MPKAHSTSLAETPRPSWHSSLLPYKTVHPPVSPQPKCRAKRLGISFFFGNSFFFELFYFLTSQYCIGFAIYQHESATGIHMFPILTPPPSSLPIPSLWVIPVHQSQASSIVHQTWTGDSFHIWYYNVSMPFSQIIPLILTWVLKINKKKCGLDKDFRAG